jgi:hypothetical protein
MHDIAHSVGKGSYFYLESTLAGEACKMVLRSPSIVFVFPVPGGP